MRKPIPIQLALIVLFMSSIIYAQNQNMTIKYPKTKKINTVDTYFGTKVEDPYRWLEDDRSAETEAWVKAENKVTFDYLNKNPFRDVIKDRLTQLWNYEKFGSPFKRGDYYYFYKNDGLQKSICIIPPET